jgi:hypothetical protein
MRIAFESGDERDVIFFEKLEKEKFIKKKLKNNQLPKFTK